MQAPNANISQDLGDGANGVQLSSFEKEICALKKELGTSGAHDLHNCIEAPNW